MALFEDVVLRDSIEVKTSPEKAFKFLTIIVDDDTYRACTKGTMLVSGSYRENRGRKGLFCMLKSIFMESCIN